MRATLPPQDDGFHLAHTHLMAYGAHAVMFSATPCLDEAMVAGTSHIIVLAVNEFTGRSQSIYQQIQAKLSSIFLPNAIQSFGITDNA
jgi:acyl-CoA thioesterase FadM